MDMQQTFQSSRIGRFLGSSKWFSWYFGIGIPPALFGAMLVAFRHGWWWGLIVNAAIAGWLIETFTTACSRCRFHGTAKCGLPGLIAGAVIPKKDPFSISRRRVELHLALDVTIIVLVNLTWMTAFFPVWPLIALNTVGGYLTVYRRKRFHGLLYRLKDQTHAPAATATSSVPVEIGVRHDSIRSTAVNVARRQRSTAA